LLFCYQKFITDSAQNLSLQIWLSGLNIKMYLKNILKC